MPTPILPPDVAREWLARIEPNIRIAFVALSELCDEWFSGTQGFSRQNFDGDCMLAVTELAEAVEADRKNAPDSHLPDFPGRDVEIADTLVRLFHLAGKYNLNIYSAFMAKMEYNLSRPVKHGKEY